MVERLQFSLPVLPATNAHGCARSDPHANEFQGDAGGWDPQFSRRGFLATMGASLALAGAAAGVGGCSDRPDEAIVPYVDPPEQVVPGEPQFFATTLTRGGYGRGVIVTSREGRPIKIEGNPDHPASLGACDAITQASILSLYDSLRSNTVTDAGIASTWGAFVQALNRRADVHAADGGRGLAVLVGPQSGLTANTLYKQVKSRFPDARFHAHDPLDRAFVADGLRLFPVYDLSACEVIVSFDHDFLSDDPGSLAYARQFADGRRVAQGPTMNRLYVAEPDVSIAGSRADHRLPCTPSRAGVLLFALATQMGVGNRAMAGDLTRREAAWLSAVASDLNASRGRCVMMTGPHQPQAVQAMAYTLNTHLGNVQKTVRLLDVNLTQPFDDQAPASLATLPQLVEDLRAGRVRTLIVLADNPARTAPADCGFAAELTRLSRRSDAFTAHSGLYANETAFACQWHVPAQHELEMWGDAVAFDGTNSLLQPLIAPLTSGKSCIDILNLLAGQADRSAFDTVRGVWRQDREPIDDAGFEDWWRQTLSNGTVPYSSTKFDGLPADFKTAVGALPTDGGGLEIIFRPDPSVHDGSLFHNAWLQELPRPLTKIVWGNAALMSPATADRYGVGDGDVVKLESAGRSIDIPVLTLPGIADNVAVLHLGYGAHQIVNGDAAWASANVPYGTDVYPLRTSASPGYATGVTLTAAGRKEKIVRSHNHHALAADASADPSVSKTLSPQAIATPETSDDDLELHNRKLIRTATLAQFIKTPDFAQTMESEATKSLYPGWNYDTGPQWGMTIDLTSCIGCNACVVACQAENNIPVVGPDQVDRQRDMHWLRIDSYLDKNNRVHHQPVPCMHCENAPCEYVCPVAATTHSVEGLNQMTYNRCVGTRYCSNNCPYKVRRFNFLNYTFYQPDSYKMQKNPDVTVRGRGVMEKCTYCVQRINYAQRKTEIALLNAGVEPGGALQHEMLGRLQTACQQTCPTNAIRFGDLTDANAQVVKDKRSPLNYGLLVELTTKPRTTYLASITNPSPAMENPS